MNLFVLGLRRSGTTILYDALGEDPGLRRVYEPLREDAETIGGGSGARDEDVSPRPGPSGSCFAPSATRSCRSSSSTGAGRGRPSSSSRPSCPRTAASCSSTCSTGRRTWRSRRHACITSFRRSPRSTRGRRSSTWSATRAPSPPRCCSAVAGAPTSTPTPRPSSPPARGAGCGRAGASPRSVIARRRSLDIPADIPDFLRPLLVWKAAFETTAGDGERLFGERYALVRLEDLRLDPRRELERIYGLTGRPLPDAVTEWAIENIRRDARHRSRRGPPLGAGGAADRDGGRARSRRLRRDPRARSRRGAGSTSPPRRRARGSRGSWAEPGAASPSARFRAVKARVLIRPKEGILDPQGKAVERALPALGFDGRLPRADRAPGRARGRGRRRPRGALREAAREPVGRGLRGGEIRRRRADRCTRADGRR